MRKDPEIYQNMKRFFKTMAMVINQSNFRRLINVDQRFFKEQNTN